MSRAYAHSGFSFARRQSAQEPIAPPPRRPFSKPKTNLQPGSDSHLKMAQIIQFPSSTPSTIKPEAMDKLPPMAVHLIHSRPEPRMSDAAKHFHMLRIRLQFCLEDRRYDAEVFPTECRLREQAAYIIGYLA